MRLVTLSDIHIKEIGDDGYRCLISFLGNPLTQTATHIALLGDIFDLMAGDHEQYIKRWQEIFEKLRLLCSKGVVVYVAEGNHDMHLTKLFERVRASWGVEAGHRLQVIQDYKIIEGLNKKIYLSHGDEFNQLDLAYLKYKKIIKNNFFKFVANFIMPLSVLDYVGKIASKKSRAYGERTYNEDDVRQKFRNGLGGLVPPNVNIVIGGHSHVKDDIVVGGFHYLNNGYPPKSKCFVVFDEFGARLETL